MIFPRVARHAILACIFAGAGMAARGQEKPLLRTFSPGANESFRMEMTVRLELRGVRTETIGAKTYVKPFMQAAEASLGWMAARRTGNVAADGSTEIEESRDAPSVTYATAQDADEDVKKMQQELQRICEGWRNPPLLHYRERRDGHIQKLNPEEVGEIESDDPKLLTLWLMRALRPSVILPAEPLRFGERWQRASHAKNPPWVSVQGSETGEWMEAAGDSPAAILHITQDISGEIPPAQKSDGKETAKEAARRGNFFAESLSTVSLLDGSLLSATRSAARTTTWTLARVEGLPEPPQFSSKIAVTVTIHRLP